MSVYFLANIRIHDNDEYNKYIARSDAVFKKFAGKYITVDGNPVKLEGHWDYSRLVMIEFPDQKAFEAWYCSAEYQEILKIRLKAADCDSILVASK